MARYRKRHASLRRIEDDMMPAKCYSCGSEFPDGVALYLHVEMNHPSAARPFVAEDVAQPTPLESPPAVGMKFDTGKPRWDLMPPIAEKAVVDVLTYGAGKYAPENWRKVEGWRWRYWRAAKGHIWKWATGEWLDEESGQPHLAHAICCLLFIIELETERREKK
jgi:hypothetical protein